MNVSSSGIPVQAPSLAPQNQVPQGTVRHALVPVFDCHPAEARPRAGRQVMGYGTVVFPPPRTSSLKPPRINQAPAGPASRATLAALAGRLDGMAEQCTVAGDEDFAQLAQAVGMLLTSKDSGHSIVLGRRRNTTPEDHALIGLTICAIDNRPQQVPELLLSAAALAPDREHLFGMLLAYARAASDATAPHRPQHGDRANALDQIERMPKLLMALSRDSLTEPAFHFDKLHGALHGLTHAMTPSWRAFAGAVLGRYPVPQDKQPGCASLIRITMCALADDPSGAPDLLRAAAACRTIPSDQFHSLIAYAANVIPNTRGGNVLDKLRAIERTVGHLRASPNSTNTAWRSLHMNNLTGQLQEIVMGTAPPMRAFCGAALARLGWRSESDGPGGGLRDFPILHLTISILQVAYNNGQRDEPIEKFMALPIGAGKGGIGSIYALFSDGLEPTESQLVEHLGTLKQGRSNRAAGQFHCNVLMRYFAGTGEADQLAPNPLVGLVCEKSIQLEALGMDDAVAMMAEKRPARYGGKFGKILAQAAILTHPEVLNRTSNAAPKAAATRRAPDAQRAATMQIALEMAERTAKWNAAQAAKPQEERSPPRP